MTTPLERLNQLNKENHKAVTVNVGLLNSAIREINSHAAISGKGVMTDMVLNGLKMAIERAGG